MNCTRGDGLIILRVITPGHPIGIAREVILQIKSIPALVWPA